MNNLKLENPATLAHSGFTCRNLKPSSHRLARAAFCFLFSAFCFPLSAFSQGSAFTYQGRLDAGGAPATGIFDLRFTIYDAVSVGAQQGDSLTNAAVPVSNGLFAVTLDFGNQFPGADRWLEIAVRTNGGGAFSTLSPRQQLTATPYAKHAAYAASAATAGAVSAANISGTIPLTQLPASLVTNGASGVNFFGTFTGEGTGLTNLNAWKLGGNAGTTPATHFLGTTDNQPLEFRVNQQRTLRLEPNTGGAPNVIGGAAVNFVSPGVQGATISGGGATNVFGQSFTNRVLANLSTVSGGADNTAGDIFATVGGGRANHATGISALVAGGWYNTASGGAATVGGGENNTATGGAATVTGGNQNTASGDYATVGGSYNTGSGLAATVGGGSQNIASGLSATVAGGGSNQATNNYAAIGGGYGNQAEGQHAIVPGGLFSQAAGASSFAAGRRAKALHNGAFNWADAQDADFYSTTSNQFNVRAAGGARFITSGAGLTVDGQPVLAGLNGGSLTNLNASQLAGGIVPAAALSNAWKIGGNSGTSPAANFLGTADNQPMELKVNGSRVLRLEPNATSPNVIGGSVANMVSNGVVGAFIGGGGSTSYTNRVGGSYGAVVGGAGNTASGEISTAMGFFTTASGDISAAMGWNTTASGGMSTAMGWNTTASGGVSTAMGSGTTASGQNATALGNASQATHNNTFVWSDGSSPAFASSAANQFLIQATGGVGINTNNPQGTALSVNGDQMLTGTLSAIGADIATTLNVGAAATVGSLLTVGGQISAQSASFVTALNLNGTATVGTDITAGRDVTVGRNLLAAGSAGVGTAIPQAPLHIYSPQNPTIIRVQSSAQPGFGRLEFFSNPQGDANEWRPGYIQSTDAGIFTGGLAFYVNGTGAGSKFGSNEVMRIQNGRVGIGTTSPQSPLHVQGTARVIGADQWDVNNTEGDFRVGSDTHRFKIGVAQGGSGAGDVWMRPQGGTGRLFLKTPGGTTIFSNEAQTNGVSLAAGGGSWTSVSDRNAKENFEPVHAQDILAKVASLPLSKWNYKSQDAEIRHLGPMAQDFKAAFGLGETDAGITSVDADGVALAAIQGLNQKVEAELEQKEAEIKQLKARLEKLEQLLNQQLNQNQP